MSKRSRGKKGTADSATQRDNKGRFLRGCMEQLSATSAAPVSVGTNDTTNDGTVEEWLSDLTSLPSDEESELNNTVVTTTGNRLDRVHIDKYHTASSDMEVGPSQKRQKMSSMSSLSSAKETIPLLSTLRWVHETMKQGLIEAHSKTAQEFTNYCNWWYQAILWKKRDFSKTDKDHFCQAAFGTVASQLQYNEDCNAITGNEPIGVKIHRQWTKYGKQINRELPKNFEALLLMFWSHQIGRDLWTYGLEL